MVGYFLQLATIRMSADISFKLNVLIIEHYGELEISLEEGKNIAYLSQRINSDANHVISFVFSSLSSILIKIVSTVLIASLLLRYSATMFFVLIFLITSYFIIYTLMKGKIFQKGLVLREATNVLFGGLTERLAKTKFIEIHNIEDHYKKLLNGQYDLFLNHKLNYQKLTYTFGSLDSVLTLFSQIAVYLIGGVAVIRNVISIGFFTMFISYTGMLFNEIKYFLNFGKNYQEARVSYERIMEIMGKPVPRKGSEILHSINSIRLENLKFKYSDKFILDMSYTFTKGSIYCIIGGNGTGKTTLCDLLVGMYAHRYEGSIFFNETELKQLCIEKARHAIIGISEQGTTIMNGSILDNLSLTTSDSTDTESMIPLVESLIDYFNLNLFIAQQHDGLYANVNEENMNLSGGEKQKISLIRLFLQNPEVMIFDEPTSALDGKSTTQFIKLIKKIQKEKIIIIVSHDMSLHSIADIILDLTSER